MNSQLQSTLSAFLNSGWQNNQALKVLVDDYVKYHIVLLVFGGMVLLISLVLTMYFWFKFARTAKISRFKWPFEKKVFFSFGLTLTLFSLFFALVFAANLSTVLKPLPGFTSLALSTTVPSDSQTGTELIQWAQSNDKTPPQALQQKVQDRISWQRPKAIICSLLLVIFTVVTVYIWSHLIKRSRMDGAKSTPKDRLLMIAGSGTFALCLLLAIMAVANAQGALAPYVISLLGAGS